MKTTDKYYLDGNKKYHRVTNILSFLQPGIEHMRKRNPAKLNKLALDGKRVHALCAEHAKKKGRYRVKSYIQKADPVAYARYLQYRKWAEENVKEFICAEQTVKDKSLMLAGTPDQIVKLKNNQNALIDIKTGIESKTHMLQTAAYMKMCGNKYGKISKRYALYLYKDGYRLVNHDNYDHDIQMFLSAYNVYTNFLIK